MLKTVKKSITDIAGFIAEASLINANAKTESSTPLQMMKTLLKSSKSRMPAERLLKSCQNLSSHVEAMLSGMKAKRWRRRLRIYGILVSMQQNS